MRRWGLGVRIKSKGSGKFRKAHFKEKGGLLYNPGCGWYHIYTFTAEPRKEGMPVENEVWLDEACKKEKLALVLIDIGEFRTHELSGTALLHIGEIFKFFREKDKQMILRIAYDTKGRGAVHEPSDISLVKRHMEQLGSILREFAGDILVIQGIFVGSWGEMHGSGFLGREAVCELVHTLYEVTEGRCYLAVRTPALRRMIEEAFGTEGKLRDRLALFNDGIFGSSTDLGTYGALSMGEAKASEKWRPADELMWQDIHAGLSPNGGEALEGLELGGYGQAAEVMGKMHLSYLNSIYQPERLEGWKREIIKEEGCWKGLSGYDYIGGRLGYRFVVRDAELTDRGLLRISIENTGFSNLLEPADCFLAEEDEKGERSRQRLEADACLWRCGRYTQIQAALPKMREDSKCCRLFLELKRKSDKRPLRFANQGEEDRVLLGEYTQC